MTFSHFVCGCCTGYWIENEWWGQRETRRSVGKLSRIVVTALPSGVAVGVGSAEGRCEMQLPGLADGLRERRKRESTRTHLALPSLKCRSRWRGLLSWKCLLDGQVEMPRWYSSLKRIWAGQESLPGNSWKVYLMPGNCVDSLKNRV